MADLLEVILPVVLAFLSIISLAIGWVVTYLQTKELESYKAQLAHIQTQLSEFHGPLFFQLMSEEKLWSVFRDKYRDQYGPGPYYGLGQVETVQGLLHFRHWNSTVFQVQTRSIRDLILAKGYLAEPWLVDGVLKLPECLTSFCACVAAYEPLMAKWPEQQAELQGKNPQAEYQIDENFLEANIGLLEFPVEIVQYATRSYLELMERQQQLWQKLKKGEKMHVEALVPYELQNKQQKPSKLARIGRNTVYPEPIKPPQTVWMQPAQPE